MLGGKAPTKGAAQPGPIKMLGDLFIAAPPRHGVNLFDSFFGRLQRAFPRGWPLHDMLGDRARAPMNLDFNLSRLSDSIQLYGFDRHAQELLPLPVRGR